MKDSPLSPPIQIGGWLVQPSLNSLEHDGTTIRVTPKVMQVLCSLASAPGEAVTREQLMDHVWSGTVVTEEVLTRAVSELRKVFQDDPQDPQFIQTIPTVGYRLIAPVAHLYGGGAMPTPMHPVGAPLPAPSRPLQAPPAAHPWRWMLPVLILLLLGGAVLWRWSSPETPAAPLQTLPFSSFPGSERYPALSPDGNQVAFAWAGETDGNWDIYLKQRDNDTPLRITSDPAREAGPTWAPDGTRLAFGRYEAGTCTLFEIPSLGGQARKLASCGNNEHADFAWSPDGRWIAYSDRDAPDESFAIYLLSTETLERRKLTHPSAQHWGDRSPSFSPDGSRVAYTASVSAETQDIFIVPVEGGASRPLTSEARNLAGHTWTPDGRHLVFASDHGGNTSLWKVPARGGEAAWVAVNAVDARQPHMNTGSGLLILEQWREDVNLWRAEIASAPDSSAPPGAARWAGSTRDEIHPQYAPDGSRVAFASSRSGSYEIWVSDRSGAGPVQLTHFGGPFVGSPRWSPDGRYLAFDARPEGHADVYVIDAEGGLPRRLTDAPSNELAPSWSPDGASIYFGSNRTGAWQIWRMPAEGGLPAPVTTEGGYAAQASPDGTVVYFTRYDRRGIWQVPAGGGPEAPVANTEGLQGWGNWQPSAAGIYLVYRTPDGLALGLLPYGAAALTPLATLSLVPASPGLAVAPDGREALFSQVDRRESDLLLIDGFP